MSHINLGHNGELIRRRNRKEQKAVGKNGACAYRAIILPRDSKEFYSVKSP